MTLRTLPMESQILTILASNNFLKLFEKVPKIGEKYNTPNIKNTINLGLKMLGFETGILDL